MGLVFYIVARYLPEDNNKIDSQNTYNEIEFIVPFFLAVLGIHQNKTMHLFQFQKIKGFI